MKTKVIKFINHMLVVVLTCSAIISGQTSIRGMWSVCSRSCGTGLTNRTVQCPVGDQTCSGVKYEYMLCNTQPCAKKQVDLRYEQCSKYNTQPFHGALYDWVPFIDEQSPCGLICRSNDQDNWISSKFAEKVADGTGCKDGGRNICIEGKCLEVGCDDVVGSGAVKDECGVCGGDGTTCQLPSGNKYQWSADWLPCSVTCGTGYQKNQISCKDMNTGLKVLEANCDSKGRPHEMTMECVQDDCDDVPIELAVALCEGGDCPKWEVGDWLPCSATCGRGFQYRTVDCSKENCPHHTKPDERRECVSNIVCPDIKPITAEDSSSTSDNLLGTVNVTSYKWKLYNFTTCSKTCLEGVQYPNLHCMDTKDNIIDPSFCSSTKKPVLKARPCNRGPCPPRWEVGEYGPCTAECGGGKQERPVLCMQQESDMKNFRVDEVRCPPPMPMSEKSCNTQFCPALWMTGNWSQCSSSCGVGLQTRRAYCVESPIAGRQVTVSDTKCMGPKPSTSRECHSGSCFGEETAPPVIKSENYTFVQFRRSKRVKLIVGGHVVLLPGQSVIIKCPVKNYQRKLIFWSKGYKLIPMAGRIQTTFSGNLRLRKTIPALDEGTYTCIAGAESATIDITFQSKRDANKKSREMQTFLAKSNRAANLNLPLRDAAGSGAVRDPHYNSSKQLIFSTGPWSECSKTCGSGHQKREVTCTKITFKYMKILSDRECIKRGMKKPEVMKKCLIQEDCPTWEIGKWSKCKKDQCVRDGYAQKKRPIHCTYSNGTRAPLAVCHALERPQHKMECSSFDCYSVWKTTKWSECYPRCAKKGYKSRTLTCVWKRSKKPAWSACKGKIRPIAKKTCSPKPCAEECEDKSRYCNLVGMLKMCRYSNFRFNCCATCQDYLRRNS